METINDIINLLPSFEKCDELIINEGRVLITAGGFEDRALAVASITDRSSNGRAIVLNYKPTNKRNKLNNVITTLKSKGVKIDEKDIIEFDRYQPEIFPNFLQNRLIEVNAQKVIVDITAMSKLALLLCLTVCWEMNINISVVYTEAQEKSPQKDEYEKARVNNNLQQPSIQVYTGIHGVMRVPQLSSVAMQGQPSAAIVFMSFNDLLTQALLNTVYPSRLFLINSRSPKWEWREEATAWIHEQLRKEWAASDNPVNEQLGNILPQRVVSTFDYKETIKILLELYWELSPEHRILLAPTGSKQQTLGCFFVKVLHPDIHIEYPTPEGFLDMYSSGIGQTWLADFGALQDKINIMHTKERQLFLGIKSTS
jgi:hypothetical protein